MPYTLEERIWLGPLDEEKRAIRAETNMAWNISQYAHPFGPLQQALMMTMEPSLDSPAQLLSELSITQVTMSIASRPSQSLETDTLQEIPLWGTDRRPQFPNGFWLGIESKQQLTEKRLQRMVHHWIDQRVITTPLKGGVSWDVEGTAGHYLHQVFLPTNGAAWSADAWHQTMQALLPCQNFMGLSALDWSQLLVEGKATHKQFWLHWSEGKATMGLQWRSVDSDIPPALLSEQSSCALATKSIHHLSSSSSSSSNPKNAATLEQVIRRPNSPNQGRLETWFATSQDDQQNCQFQLRQRLPYYMDPQWRSLLITSSTEYKATVEWQNEDWSSILRISADKVPSSLIVSLDYEPAFLSLDEFPGDPNRGRELLPAVISIQCDTTTTTTTSHPHHVLYSNSVMILPPVPDMSMPFNVLSLSCSLYAYLIGTVFTLLVKRASERIRYQLHPDQKPQSKWQRLVEKFRKRKATDAIPKASSEETTCIEKEYPTSTQEVSTIWVPADTTNADNQ